MTYKTEFPDFVLDVEIPEGFKDTSWRNDMTPCWEDQGKGLILWIDYKDPTLKEHEETPRFCLASIKDDKTLVQSNDYADVISFITTARIGGWGKPSPSKSFTQDNKKS